MAFLDQMYDNAPRKLRPAIDELGIALKTMQNNEPINRKEGNIKQAELERKNGASFTAAIEILGHSKKYRSLIDQMRKKQ